jgi:glycosyltransferase involved in cell wall biosynthesis
VRICLNMIVKDEAPVIERCLRSVRPFIHSWAVVDTGSRDGTQQMIRSALADLPGELEEHAWADFATNRNQALQLAKGHGDYALFVDADDVLEVADPTAMSVLDAHLYAVESRIRGVSGWNPFLARLDVDWLWKGVLHEVLTTSQEVVRRKIHGVLLHKPGGGARSRIGAREKYARDAEVLRVALEKEPGNSRYMFYLGHSLRESGQWPAAIDAYRRRSEMGGSAEEVYVAKLMVATLMEHTGVQYADVVVGYLDAYDFRPQRAEAPAQLAHYLLGRKRYTLARDVARVACSIQRPPDQLFVNNNAYGWRPWDDLAVALFELRDFSGCASAYRRVLADPHLPVGERERVERNLAQAEALQAGRA